MSLHQLPAALHGTRFRHVLLSGMALVQAVEVLMRWPHVLCDEMFGSSDSCASPLA
jgi:hypothetical protein